MQENSLSGIYIESAALLLFARSQARSKQNNVDPFHRPLELIGASVSQ